MTNQIIRIAHRGGGSGAHENKIETIKQSLVDETIDAIEVDVRKTKDNVLVLSHDRGVRTNGHIVWIDEVNFSDIAQLNIDTLDKVLPLFQKSSKILDIDIKEKESVGEIIRLFKKFRDLKQIYFSCFDIAALFEIQEEIRYGQYFLSSSMKDSQDFYRRRIIRVFLVFLSILFSRLAIVILKKKYRKVKLDGISLFYRFATKEFVNDLKTFGFQVFIWGTDKEKELKKMTSIPVDGIKTTNTALFKNIF